MPKSSATSMPTATRSCSKASTASSSSGPRRRPTVDLGQWRVAKSIFVARDEATARRYARGPLSPYVHYYTSLVTKLVKNGRSNLFKEDPDMPDSDLVLDHVL